MKDYMNEILISIVVISVVFIIAFYINRDTEMEFANQQMMAQQNYEQCPMDLKSTRTIIWVKDCNAYIKAKGN